MRIGYAKDIHKISDKKELCLGGIFFPNEEGHLAISDGDIILHALSEAILSGLGMEDIGTYFKEETSVGLSSSKILDFALDKLEKASMHFSNIVISFVSEKIILKNKKSIISANLQKLLKIKSDQISIIATKWEDSKNSFSECTVSLILI